MTIGTPDAHVRDLVAKHFRMHTAREEEVRMRQHMSACQECRGHYEAHMEMARIDPKAPSVQQRLGAPLGFNPRPRLPVWNVALAISAAVALVVAFWPVSTPSGNLARLSTPTITAGPHHPWEAEGLVARGGTEVDAQIFVQKVTGETRVPLDVDAPLNPQSELSFSYRNPKGFKYLMIFATDDSGAVHWYHPAWQDPTQNPRAISIEKRVAPQALDEAIAHDISGKQLKLFAIFSNIRNDVSTVEATVALTGANATKLQNGIEGHVWSTSLTLAAP